jgi:subtilase family serine protease
MRNYSHGRMAPAGSRRCTLPGLFGLLLLCYGAAASAQSGWVPTATQGITLGTFIIPVQSVGPLPSTTALHVLVALRVQNGAQLNSAIVAASTPGNSVHGKFLTPSQFAASYSPSSGQIQAVESYLTSMGFTNISAPTNGLYVSAYGTAATVEAAFNTPLWQYQISGPNG